LHHRKAVVGAAAPLLLGVAPLAQIVLIGDGALTLLVGAILHGAFTLGVVHAAPRVPVAVVSVAAHLLDALRAALAGILGQTLFPNARVGAGQTLGALRGVVQVHSHLVDSPILAARGHRWSGLIVAPHAHMAAVLMVLGLGVPGRHPRLIVLVCKVLLACDGLGVAVCEGAANSGVQNVQRLFTAV